MAVTELRPYGVRPRTVWIGETAKGYLREDFEEVFGQYISKAQAKAMLEELRTLAERRKGPTAGVFPPLNLRSARSADCQHKKDRSNLET